MMRLPTTVTAIRAALDSGDHLALSDIMEFDCPITIHEDGTVTRAGNSIDAPALYDDELDSPEYEMLNGYSGQYGHAGPIMHPSEFIGGGMARDILDEPGTYVAVAAYYSAEFVWQAAGSVQCRHCDAWIMPDGEGAWVGEDDEHPCDGHEPEDQEADGWAVARLTA